MNAVTDGDFERTLQEADAADRTVEETAYDSEALARLAIDYPLLGKSVCKFNRGESDCFLFNDNGLANFF